MWGGAVVEIFTFHYPLSLLYYNLGLCALPAAGLTSLHAFSLGEEEAGERVSDGNQHHHILATDHHLGPFLLPPLLPDRRQEMSDPRLAAHTDRVAMQEREREGGEM